VLASLLGVTIPAVASQAAPASSAQKIDHSNVGATHSPQVLHMFARTASGSAVTGSMVSQSTMATALQGVDVASFQHPSGASIDWSKVAGGGIQFAAVKATEGAYYENPYALTDLADAKAAGLSTVAYAFAIPNGNSTIANSANPVVQADYLLSYLGTDSTTVPIMLDIENNPYGAECYGLSQSAMVTWISQFIAEVQKKTSQQPIIYAPGSWWTDCTGGSAAFSQNPLWEPYFSTTVTSPALPTGWANWAFWQYSGTGTVAGISGTNNVDLDQMNPGVLPLLDPGAQRGLITKAVNLQVKPADAASGQTLSFSATGLPPGVRIGAGGQITGSPTAAGTFEVKVIASDSQGVTGSVSFSWTVVRAVLTVKYVCGRSQSHYRWLVRNVGGTFWARANATIETGRGWSWVGSKSVALTSGWNVNTYRGWKLRVYYMANGTLPPAHEAGALVSQASAPATAGRHAC
jgi:GH25 family lysozyme M1 (1,4-beta-N-acetylmuramidase)